MLGGGEARTWAPAPPAIVSDKIGSGSSGATANVVKAFARVSRVENTATADGPPLLSGKNAGKISASKDGMNIAADRSDRVAGATAAPDPASSSHLHPSVGVKSAPARESIDSSVFLSSAPLLPENEEHVVRHVLYDGLPHVGPALDRARQRQSEAYYNFQRRIHERSEAAHALVISANPLSLSVMASQLHMYRWRVTQAQTLLDATALLQEFVIEASKRGYRVRRRASRPVKQSRYAFGRGDAALKRRAKEELERLSGIKSDTAHGGATSSRGRHAIAETSASLNPNGDIADTEDRLSDASEEDEMKEADEDDAESGLSLPPPDALPRLVIVDAFTHEDLADIARHVGFVDKEYGLEMLLVLLLPGDMDAMTESMQGAGCVVRPVHHITMEDAYAAGYDLVLAHSMDHFVVDFLTSAFVSSVGRWRNDVRSKAAVGNYMSLRSVLLGELDTAALQRIVWEDGTDDVGVLELLGAQSLVTGGETKQYREANGKVSQQQGAGTEVEMAEGPTESGEGGPARECTADGDSDSTESAEVSFHVTGVPRLRNRPTTMAHFGVRLPRTHQEEQERISNFSAKRDVFAGVMSSKHKAQSARDSQQGEDKTAGKDGDMEGLHNDGYSDENDGDMGLRGRLLQKALEEELDRLLTENENKQSSIDNLQNEVLRLQRTLAAQRRHRAGAAGASDGANGQGSERPDSGSAVHLSKQQQIFILKERLEAANDRINEMLKEGRSGRGSLSLGRRGARRGGSVSASKDGAGGSPGYPGKGSSLRRRSSSFDALISQQMSDSNSLRPEAGGSLNRQELQQKDLISATRDAAAAAAAERRQRRGQEEADRLIQSLEQELKDLQGRTGGTRPNSSRAEKATRTEMYLRDRLGSVLEVLDAQKSRIQQLEELARMNGQAANSNQTLAGVKAQRKQTPRDGSPPMDIAGAAGEAGESEQRGYNTQDRTPAGTRGGARGLKTDPPMHTEGRREKPRGSLKQFTPAKRGVVGAGGVLSSKRSSKGRAAATGEISCNSSEDERTDESASRRVEAAVRDAVVRLERAHQRQIVGIVETCKKQLSQMALKLQKPPTREYTALLEEELTRTQRAQRGAWRSLQFTLNGLRSDQFDANLATQASSSAAEMTSSRALAATMIHHSGPSGSFPSFDLGDDVPSIPLGAITDPNVQRTASKVAREFAAHGLRAEYLTSELHRVERIRTALKGQASKTGATSMPVVGEPSLEQVLCAHREAKARVQETLDSCGSMGAYLEALQAELAAEHQLRPWCDLDSAQLFEATQKTTTPAEQLRMSTTSSLPPSPAVTALVQCTLCLDASTSDASRAEGGAVDIRDVEDVSLAGNQSLSFVDVDGSMRDVAGLYGTLLSMMDSRNRRSIMDMSCTDSRKSSRAARSTRASVAERQRSFTLTAEPSRPAGRQHRVTRLQEAKATSKRESPASDDEVVSLPSSERRHLTMEEAVSQLPVKSNEVACYMGQLSSIYISEGVYSVAQKRLYELVLRAYQQHLVHPTHMAAVEQALSLPLANPRIRDGHFERGEANDTLSHTNEVLAEVMSAQATNARAQHREILILLDLMTPTMPQALRTFTKGLQEVQVLLDGEENNSSSPEGLNEDESLYTSPVFLTALDVALLGCIVDELQWRRWRPSLSSRKESSIAFKPEASPDNDTDPSKLAMSLAFTRLRRSRVSTCDAYSGDGGTALEEAQSAAHYVAFCAARERESRDPATSPNTSSPWDPFPESPKAEDMFFLTGVPSAQEFPVDSNLFAAIHRDEGDASSRAFKELAARFSKRYSRLTDGDEEAAATMLEELYLGGEGDTSDQSQKANPETVGNIRRELENLEASNQQRVVELMKWFQSQRGSRPVSSAHSSGAVSRVGASRSRVTERQPLLPSVEPERLDFEVKSGSPAWYGMETTSRVHNILRRRAGPDQVIVSGGPNGGSVGIELSRRTALPALRAARTGKVAKVENDGAAFEGSAPETEDEDGRCSSDEEARYGPSQSNFHKQPVGLTGPSPPKARLPPLQHPGLRGAHQLRQHGGRNGLDTPLMAGMGYVSPRDVLSLSAYGHVTSNGAYAYTDACEPFYANRELAEQLLIYRNSLRSAVGYGWPTASKSYADGSPFCMRLLSPRRRDVFGYDLNDPQDRSNFRPLPDVTAWVYGVPEAHASTLVEYGLLADPEQPRDTVLFRPRYERSPMAAAAEHQRHYVPSPVPQTLLHGHRLPMGASASAFPYSTPAALAAQRLQAMLRVSMGDLSVSRAASVAARASASRRPKELPLTQGHAYPLLPRRGGGAMTASPNASAAQLRNLTPTNASDPGKHSLHTAPPLPSRQEKTMDEKKKPQKSETSDDDDDPKSFEKTQNYKEGDIA